MMRKHKVVRTGPKYVFERDKTKRRQRILKRVRGVIGKLLQLGRLVGSDMNFVLLGATRDPLDANAGYNFCACDDDDILSRIGGLLRRIDLDVARRRSGSSKKNFEYFGRSTVLEGRDKIKPNIYSFLHECFFAPRDSVADARAWKKIGEKRTYAEYGEIEDALLAAEEDAARAKAMADEADSRRGQKSASRAPNPTRIRIPFSSYIYTSDSPLDSSSSGSITPFTDASSCRDQQNPAPSYPPDPEDCENFSMVSDFVDLPMPANRGYRDPGLKRVALMMSIMINQDA